MASALCLNIMRPIPTFWTVNGQEYRVMNLQSPVPECLAAIPTGDRFWFPINYLLDESLQKLHDYLGDDLWGPTGSGQCWHSRKQQPTCPKGWHGFFLKGWIWSATFKWWNWKKIPNWPHWRDLTFFSMSISTAIMVLDLVPVIRTGWTGLVRRVWRMWQPRWSYDQGRYLIFQGLLELTPQK